MKTFHSTFISMFHEPIKSYLETSLIKKAIDNGVVSTTIISILEETGFNHHKIDDSPYGGGPGEVMRIDVVEPIVKKALSLTEHERKNKRVILLDPASHVFDQNAAKRLSSYDELIFVCGRYEGIDSRIHHFVDESLSLGDFILTNGELASLCIFDSVVRLKPHVLGNFDSTVQESFSQGRLEASSYTRPMSYLGYHVPDILKNGDHKAISDFKSKESLVRTLKIRPDLFLKTPLTECEEKILLNQTKKVNYPWQKNDQ